MNRERLQERLDQYRKAVSRLREALNEDVSNPLLYDGVIQRFEFTYELAWKLIKAYLEHEGITEVNSPRAAFKEAFALGLITDGDVWLGMLDARNLTVHTYDEQRAKEIYEMIKHKFYSRFAELASRMAEVLK